MPRDLGDVLDYLLPSARLPSTQASQSAPPDSAPEISRSAKVPRPAALPIVTLPIGDDDAVRAAFAWNLAIEVARLGGNATLLAPDDTDQASLWPAEGRGPIGAELALVPARDLRALNRAALDFAVSKAADSSDGGVVFVRMPPKWIDAAAEGRALLRWLLLFSSPDSRDLSETYATAKRVLRNRSTTRVGVTIHGARHIEDAEQAFGRLARAVLKHLRHPLVSYGLLVDDLHIYRASVAHRPIGLEHPQSRAARALRDVSRLLLDDARSQPVG